MIKTITRNELVNRICREKDLKVVDVLDSVHFEQEHIKGAVSLPVNEIDRGARRLLRESDMIITYCASFECQASTKAAEKLMAMGFVHVLDYKGGIKDYKEAGLPMEGSWHKEESRSFPCSCATC